MEDIAISVVAKLAEYLVGPTIRHLQYLLCSGKITRNLQTEKEKLASTREIVQRRAIEARNRAETIHDDVEKWLNDANHRREEVEKLEDQLNAAKGWCPTWRRYRLSKQIAKMTKSLVQLQKGSEFTQFSVSAALPDIEYLSSGNVVYFRSTKLALDQLLEAMEDDSTYIIGLYGMGGSGKTTLVREAGNKAKQLKLFDRVVFATVSHTPNIRKIQGEIADWLGLQMKEETESGRARRLSTRLSSGERILLILDDVWEDLKLNDIGIPFEDHHSGCKVLLTTRRQRVCIMMDCQRKIHLDLLSEEEAWTLFQKHARINNGFLDLLNGVAQEVARECKGLPIAIEAVGKSLKEKSIEEWKAALIRLRDSKPIDGEAAVGDAFSCLRLSYDCLRSEEAKSIFLLCCVFPEDHDILITDLYRIGVGLGIYRDNDLLESAWVQVIQGINNLIDSCLLMKAEKRMNHVKMHDMVHDVGLWIASKENHSIMINLGKDLNEIVQGTLKNCRALNSLCKKVNCIPHQFDAPRLETLFLETEEPLTLSDTSFECMKALKVMHVTNGDMRFSSKRLIMSVPPSIKWPTNLQTLRLRGWDLGDLSWVVSLRKLQILDLRGSSFKELPIGLKELKNLKLLDLLFCEISESGYGGLASCTQLEELIYASPKPSDKSTIKPPELFPNNVTFPKLQRYFLKIGLRKLLWYPHMGSKRSLLLGQMNISTASSFIIDLLKRAEDICFFEVEGSRTVFPEVVHTVGGMNKLTHLWLHSCSNVECIIDNTTSQPGNSFDAEALLPPNLIKLKLSRLDHLKEVLCGPRIPNCFEKIEEIKIEQCTSLWRICTGESKFRNLKILRIDGCHQLTSLFPVSVARTMLMLQQLCIKNCRTLKHLIINDGEEGTETGTREEIFLALEDSSLLFPQLKIISITCCPQLKSTFPVSSQSLVQLEQIYMEQASELKYVFGQNGDADNEVMIELPRLHSIRLVGLTNLLGIFPGKYYSRCPSLMELDWVCCPKFPVLFTDMLVGLNPKQLGDPNMVDVTKGSDQSNYEVPTVLAAALSVKELHLKNSGVMNLFQLHGIDLAGGIMMTSKLERFELRNLPELRFKWSGSCGKHVLSLQYLRSLSIFQCRELKCVFSVVVCRMLPELKHLTVSDCEELEDIVAMNEEPQNLSSGEVGFPKLTKLKVERCNKLEYLFSAASAGEEIVLPNLKHVVLQKLPSLIGISQGFKFHKAKVNRFFINECPKLNLLQ